MRSGGGSGANPEIPSNAERTRAAVGSVAVDRDVGVRGGADAHRARAGGCALSGRAEGAAPSPWYGAMAMSEKALGTPCGGRRIVTAPYKWRFCAVLVHE